MTTPLLAEGGRPEKRLNMLIEVLAEAVLSIWREDCKSLTPSRDHLSGMGQEKTSDNEHAKGLASS